MNDISRLFQESCVLIQRQMFSVFVSKCSLIAVVERRNDLWIEVSGELKSGQLAAARAALET